MVLNFPGNQETASDKLTQEEMSLLQLFRSLTPEQQEFYLEEGKIFVRHNNKKESIIPIRPDE